MKSGNAHADSSGWQQRARCTRKRTKAVSVKVHLCWLMLPMLSAPLSIVTAITVATVTTNYKCRTAATALFTSIAATASLNDRAVPRARKHKDACASKAAIWVLSDRGIRAFWVFRGVVFQDVGFEHNSLKPLTHISFRCEVPTP